jgi:hypothetical protein
VTGTLPAKDEEDPLGVFGDFGKLEDRPDAKERTVLPLLALEEARLSTNAVNYQRGKIVVPCQTLEINFEYFGLFYRLV